MMKRRFKQGIRISRKLIVLVAALLCSASLHAAKPSKPGGAGGGGDAAALYSLSDLGGFTGGGKRHLQIANAINNAGHVAGLLTLGKPVSEQHGFLLVPKL